MALHEYRRRRDTTVLAMKLELDTPGFDYEKWGGRQHCKAGDWIVKNGDDVYTVDADVFARTYSHVSGAEYRKSSTVWAEPQSKPGSVRTKEGSTAYGAGDYLVFNDREQSDGYAIERSKFEAMYEPA